MLTEAVVLSLITVFGGGSFGIAKKYLEGKYNTEIEKIKSEAEKLRSELDSSNLERDEFEQEVEELEKKIDQLEERVERWKNKFWDLQVDTQELKIIFLKALEKSDLPTDEFQAIMDRLRQEP